MSSTIGGGKQAPLKNGSVHAKHILTGNTATTTTLRSVQVQQTSAVVAARTDNTPCKVATTADHGLSGTANVDSVAISAGDRILVWQQSTASENGVYIAASGGWTRAGDSILHGYMWHVAQGTTYADTLFTCTNDTDPTVDTDSINFATVGGGTIDGTGTTDTIAKWSDSDTLTDSQITDNGTSVVVNGPGGGVGHFEAIGSGATLDPAYFLYTGTTTARAAAKAVASGSGATALRAEASLGTGAQISGSSGLAVTGTTTTGDVCSITSTASIAGRTMVVNGTNTGQTGDVLYVAADGTGRAGYFYRDVSGATQAVAEVRQDHASNNVNALRVINDGTGSSAGGLYITSVGGAGVFSETTTGVTLYGYRDSNTASSETAVIWQDHTGDANDVLRVRGDGTGKLFHVQDGATSVFVIEDDGVVDSTGSGRVLETVTKSAAYTLTENDHVIFVDTNAAAGNVTLTLPATPRDGQIYLVIDSTNNAATNNIILGRNGNNIDGGAANYTMNTNGSRVQVVSDGTDWFTI